MASLKKCIEEKCKDCTYDSSSPGSWRHQVEECTVTKCPLWLVRPMTMETINKNRNSGKVIPIEVDTKSILDGLEDEEETEESVA